MADGKALKAKALTQLQWEFIMTAWKQSRDFGEMRDRSRVYFRWGTKAFYQVRGKWVHGKQFQWPAMRFAGDSEETLSQHLYLNWDKENTIPIQQPRLIGKHRNQTLEELSRVNDTQPFSIYGTSRVEEDLTGGESPFKVIDGKLSLGGNGESHGNGHAETPGNGNAEGNGKGETHTRHDIADQPVAGD
jgi:hypothetical protein